MIQSDYYADVNPAFCSLILCNFVLNYHSQSNSCPTYPLMIIPIPLVLSGEIDRFFNNKQLRSDLFLLLSQDPAVLFSLSNRIRDSLQITQNALAFSFQNRVLAFNTETKKFLPTERAKQLTNNKFNSTIRNYLKKSTLLGTWFGRINSESTIYSHLGISL